MAAPRAIWKGSIAIGLVGVPVKLYSATEEKNIRFHQVHAADGGQIEMHRICKKDGEEVPYAEIAKGFEVSQGEYVILTDDDLAEVPVPTAKTITLEVFVPAEQVDPIYFDKAYYLAPDGEAALKPYLLLLRSMEDSGRVGVAKIALRQKEHLAALYVRDRTLVLSMMLWPDEVREPDFGFLDKETTLRKQERQMADSLVESMAGDFQPDDFTDEYREGVRELVEAKIEGREVTTAPAAKSTKGTELLDMLAASVEAAKKARQGTPKKVTAKTPPTKAPARKATKAPAKKTVVKKTAVKEKKPAAKRTTSKKAT